MGIFTHPPGGAESGLPNPVTLATFNQNKKESFMGIFTHPVGPNPAYRIRSHLRRGLRIRVASSVFGDGGSCYPGI